MAKSFRDIAQDLRTKPGLRLPNGKLLDRLFVIQTTEPVSAFEACIRSEAKTVARAIAVSSPATVVTDADYALNIAGSWGGTFTVRVGGTAQHTGDRLCLPSGTTQSQFLSRLFERLANEHSVCPSFTSGGALAIFLPTGTEAVSSVPSGFLSLASGTANFVSPQAATKYRPGAPHPDCDFLRLFQVESSGRDDHNVNLTLFYRVDLDLLGTAMGTTGDALRARTGYEISEPHDAATYPRVQWTFEVVNPEAYNRPANGTAHPWVAGCILTNEARSEQQGATIVTRIYEPIPGPWIWKTADDGSDDTQTAFRRVIHASPGADADAPDGYVRTGRQLDPDASIYTATLSLSFIKVPGPPQIAWSLDTETSRSLPTRTTIVAAATVPSFNPASPTNGNAIDSNGVSTEYRPQGRHLATKIETLQIPPASGSPSAPATREWWTSINFYWPPVLLALHISPIPYIGGGAEYRVIMDMLDGYHGPCKARVLETFHAVLPSDLADGSGLILDQMRPRGFAFNGARLNFSVPECLHGSHAITETINSDSSFADQVYTLNVGATNHTQWPANIVADHEVRPWRGGWLERKTTVYRPPITVGETSSGAVVP